MTSEDVYYEEKGPRRCSIRKLSLPVPNCDGRKLSTGSDGSISGSDNGSYDGGGSSGIRRKVGVVSLNGDLQNLIANAPSNITRKGSKEVPSPSSACSSASQTPRNSEDNISILDAEFSCHSLFPSSSDGIPPSYTARKISRSFSEGHDTLVTCTEVTRRNLAKMRMLRGHTSDHTYDTAWDLQDTAPEGDEPSHRKSFIPVIDMDKIRKISHADRSDLTKLMDMTKQLNLNPRRPSYLTWRASQNVAANGKRRLHSLSEHGGALDTGADKDNFDGNNNASVNEGPQCDTPCQVTITVTEDPGSHVTDCEHLPSRTEALEEEASVDGEGGTFSMSDRCKNINQSLEWIKSELVEMRHHDYTLAKQLVRLRKEIHHFRLQRCYLENSSLLEDAIDESAEEREMELFDFCDMLPRLFNPELKYYGLTRMNMNMRRFSVF